MPSTRQQTCRVCIEDTHTDTVSIFEHRTRDTGYREWCHKVPRVSLWQTLCHHNRSQTFVHDTQQAAEECTSTSTTPSAQDTCISPGNQMIMADVVSRLPNPEKNAEIPLDVTVDDIVLDVDHENACSIDLINFSINKRVPLREMSTADHLLFALQRVVYHGWPDTIKGLPEDCRPYWSYRDEIDISDGVIFKGKQVIMPDAMRSDILHQLHAAHLGNEKTRLLTRKCV